MNCRTCRHARTEKRRQVIDVAFDEIVEFADEDQTVYHCMSASSRFRGLEVGFEPVDAQTCGGFEAGSKGSSTADALLARFEERQRNRCEEE